MLSSLNCPCFSPCSVGGYSLGWFSSPPCFHTFYWSFPTLLYFLHNFDLECCNIFLLGMYPYKWRCFGATLFSCTSILHLLIAPQFKPCDVAAISATETILLSLVVYWSTCAVATNTISEYDKTISAPVLPFSSIIFGAYLSQKYCHFPHLNALVHTLSRIIKWTIFLCKFNLTLVAMIIYKQHNNN